MNARDPSLSEIRHVPRYVAAIAKRINPSAERIFRELWLQRVGVPLEEHSVDCAIADSWNRSLPDPAFARYHSAKRSRRGEQAIAHRDVAANVVFMTWGNTIWYVAAGHHQNRPVGRADLGIVGVTNHAWERFCTRVAAKGTLHGCATREDFERLMHSSFSRAAITDTALVGQRRNDLHGHQPIVTYYDDVLDLRYVVNVSDYVLITVEIPNRTEP